MIRITVLSSWAHNTPTTNPQPMRWRIDSTQPFSVSLPGIHKPSHRLPDPDIIPLGGLLESRPGLSGPVDAPRTFPSHTGPNSRVISSSGIPLPPFCSSHS